MPRSMKISVLGSGLRQSQEGPRFPLKGAFEGDIDRGIDGIDIDLDMDIDSGLAASRSWECFRGVCGGCQVGLELILLRTVLLFLVVYKLRVSL